MSNRKPRHLALVIAVAAVAVSACGGSGLSGRSGGAHGKFLVVAAESFWGSIAAQLAGDRAQVRSIIVNPATDPHSYTPTAFDGEVIAQSRLAIVNGLGYDKWADQALAASPSSDRVVLNVGDLLGLREGDNPHRWYFPANVHSVIDRIVADYVRLDPADSAYFAHRKQTFETQDLAQYNRLRQEIRARYSGVPVGYSESIFQGLGQDLGLRLLTPYSFTKVIAEGSDVSAADKQTVDNQAQSGQIRVWVYNSQNATPDVQRVSSIAEAKRIPSVTVTETLSPASESFAQWQVAELRGLLRALHSGTGR